ncbi:MAG: helix-turn-helix transcriptional regulator [Myxococcales bacterium]|nr:helix-turn-helix transcriptional regulator [Myxococcales bacterium]
MAMRLGTRLKRARLAQGLNQADIAVKVGVSQPMISNWEKGRSQPDAEDLKKLEKILGKFYKPARTGATGDDDSAALSKRADLRTWLRACEKADLSAIELSEASRVSVVQIYNLESGHAVLTRGKGRESVWKKALKTQVPTKSGDEAKEEQAIEGLGALTDFDPTKSRIAHMSGRLRLLRCERPADLVGKAQNIKTRVANHEDKFWFKAPIVSRGVHRGYRPCSSASDGTSSHQVKCRHQQAIR